MKRSLSIFIMLSVVALLSGCIVSTTPKDNPVVLLPGQAKTFTITVFPQPVKYVWLVDGSVVTGATQNTYTYMLDEVLPSQHTIQVRASYILCTDTYTWNVQYIGTNKPPIAEAGPDRNVMVGTTETLDGSGSTDPENNIVTYHWEQTGGPTVTLSDPHVVKPQFVANVPLESSLSFKLTVTDAGGLIDSDTCVITIVAITWNKTFGGAPECDSYANAAQQTSDGGYILAGFIMLPGIGGFTWLIKTDAYGIEQWNKTLGYGGFDGAHSVQQTSDGGYILAVENGIIKTDANGIEEWSKPFSNNNVKSALQTSDGGYILAGHRYHSGGVWLGKTDANGIEEWSKDLGGGVGWSAQQTSDGGYILAGSYLYQSQVYAWLIKTDSSGETCDYSGDGNCYENESKWVKTFAGRDAYSVHQTSDGGYILTGSFGLIKTDAVGIEEWNRTFGGFVWSAQQTSDGGYILAGDIAIGIGDGWLNKTDADGIDEWDKTFGGSNGDRFTSVHQTSDGGYILAGITGNDAWLIKTDAHGNAPATPTP